MSKWYKSAARNDIRLSKESDVNWKDVKKGLQWGVGIGTIPMAVSLMNQPTFSTPTKKPSATTQQQQQLPSKKEPELSQKKEPELSQNPLTHPSKTTQVDIDKLMDTILQMESSGGINTNSRFEPAFLKRYGNKGFMPELRKRFGDRAAASSYGPYQVMLLKSWEMGFKYTPQELEEPSNNKKVAQAIVMEYVNKGLSSWHIFQRYNGSDYYAEVASRIYTSLIKK